MNRARPVTGKRSNGVTIDNVAHAAGVSVRTVSRVLNRSPKVNQNTREAVQAVIEQLGFSPSLRARALAVGRSSLIGMVHDDPNALVLDAVQRGVVESCVERGYELVVHPSGYARADVAEDVASFVRRSRVDGVIILPPLSEVAQIPAALNIAGVPVVGLAAVRIPDYPAMLVSDERYGTTLIARHLIDLGHSRIGLITGPRGFYSATEREQGFRSALRDAGIALPPSYVQEGDYGFESGMQAARMLLALDQPPSAIFASNDIMAAGVLNAVNLLGINVPRDLSVAGFDDSVISSMVSPALTTVHRPLRQMATDATRLLIDMIENRSSGSFGDLSADLSLTIRNSTGTVPQG